MKATAKNGILLGYNRLRKAIYCLREAKNCLISGTTGAGKTFAIFRFIIYAIVNFIGLLIVDGKGDIGKGSILEFVKAFCKKHNRPLYVIDMNDPAHSAKYNPLKDANETVAKDMLINMTDWSEPHYKANAERYLQRLIRLMKLAGIELSFHSIIQNMPRERFESLSATLQKNGVISKENYLEDLQLSKTSGAIAEQACARYSTIAESEIGQIFDEDGIDIYTAVQAGAVILFVLNPLAYPETSKAMGRLILIDAKKAVSKLFNQNKRSFFAFDEAGVYASPVLTDLINKGRSAGVTSIVSVQSLSDLDAAAGEAFKNQILENCNNYIVLRQNSYSSAEQWAKTIGTKEKMEMTFQTNQSGATGLGSAKRTRCFLCHPDTIKSFSTGEGIFVSRDTGECERIKIAKPII